MKEKYFEKLLDLIRRLNSDSKEESLANEEIGEIWDEIWEIVDNASLSEITYKSFAEHDLVVLLTGNKDGPSEYNENNIAYLPFTGSSRFKFSAWDEGGHGILRIEGINNVVSLIEKLNLTTKEGFEAYYNLLPTSITQGSYRINKENVYKNLESLVQFYLDCQKNKSWIFIHCS